MIAIAVFLSAFAIDYAHARYAIARDQEKLFIASCWSVAQWGSAMVGFYVAVRISMVYLPFEALGLFFGTYYGAKR